MLACLADFRNPWTQECNYEYFKISSLALKQQIDSMLIDTLSGQNIPYNESQLLHEFFTGYYDRFVTQELKLM